VQHQIDNTNQTKEDIIKPKSIKIEEKKKAETPVPEPVAPVSKAPRPPKVKDAADQTTDATLFVRNVAWDVTQEQFKKHME
jgi:RNA recognition motif-containing protein